MKLQSSMETKQIEKNSSGLRMNKARAYRELQRRQARYTKLWTEINPLTQSLDCSSKENNRRNFVDQASVKDSEQLPFPTSKIQGNMQTIRHQQMDNRLISQPRQPGSSYIFTINDRDFSRNLARARISKPQILYSETARPVTAPETSAFATLDGQRIERSGKTQSVKSDGSEADSPREFGGAAPGRGVLTRSSINCNNINPLLRANDPSIQYPLASKMREILANDGRLIIQQGRGASQTFNMNNGRNLMKRESTSSLLSRGSHNVLLPSKNAKFPTNNAVIITKNITSNLTTICKSSALVRSTTVKQVSFQDSPHQGSIKHESTATKEVEIEGPLTLTAKNLQMLNNMVLKTMRTSKFDERIVNWVQERQFDGSKSKSKIHHPIPEIAEVESLIDTNNDVTLPAQSQSTKKPSRDKTFHIQHESLTKSADTGQTNKTAHSTLIDSNANVVQIETKPKSDQEKLS